MNIKQACAILICLLVGACGAPKLSQNFTFNETDDRGLAVFLGHPENFVPDIRFSKIDPNSFEVVDTVIACARCLLPTDVYVAGEGDEQTTVVPLRPGYYIVRGYWTEKYKWGRMVNTFHKYCLGSPIFEIKAGTAHLISLKGFRKPNTNVSAAQKALYTNHKISAPVEKTKFKGKISFEC